MGMFDFMFGGGTPEMQPTSSEQIPAYLQAAGANLVGAAQDVAQEEYIPYTDPMLAAMTPEQLAAQQQGIGMAGVSTGQMAPAMAAMQAATGGPTQAQISGYMSPYMTGVADIAAQKMQDQSLMQKQQIAASAAGAGGLDSSRYAIQEAERQKNLTTGIGDLYTKAQAAAYSQALKASQQDQAQGLRSGMAMGSLGTQAQMAEQADIAQQMGMGGLERGLGQTALDIGYTDFLGERDYPKEQLGFVSNIIRGAPFGQKTTSVGQIPQAQPRPWGQQMLGLGMQGMSMAAGLGWQPFAKG